MRATTVRFGTDLWDMLDREAGLSGVSVAQSLMASGFGASLVSGGTTPSCFCRASVASRTASQPWSNLPLYLAIHSFGTWCGAWVAPGAK